MEPFENNDFPAEAENHSPTPPESIPPQTEPSAYHGAGTGRKESPYANSPYVMNQPPRQEFQYQYQPQTEPPMKPKKERKPRKPIWKAILAAVAALALVGGSCFATAVYLNWQWEAREEALLDSYEDMLEDLRGQIGKTGPASAATLPAGTYMAPSQVYASCVDSVVAISTTIETTSFYGTSTGSSSGSGFILSEDGYVVTNYHVVENATAISVILHDDTEYSATLVGYDSTNDVAVLKCADAAGLPAVTLGSSSALIIGDMVAAIGNPLGTLASTQTIGYVSGINREVTTDNTIISMIQTDAAINPGNSGGPLFNMYGEVIGITTAKYSGTTGSGASIEGIGFAIPIDDVIPIINDLIEYGYVTGAYMGVTIRTYDDSVIDQYGLPEGAHIESVDKGGAAHRAGIQAKDVIVDLGGYPITGYNDLSRALRNFKAGDTTTVTLLRSGREIQLEITLDEKPHQTTTAPQEADPAMPSEGNPEEWYDYYFRRFFGE